MSVRGAWSGLLLSAWVGVGVTGAAPTPARLLEQLRAATLAPDAAVEIADARIDLGIGSLTLEQGLLVPTSAVAGRRLELAFHGSATLTLEPPDAIEAGQVALFTGSRSLSLSIREAVLLVGDPRVERDLLSGPAARPGKRVLSELRTGFSSWRSRSVREQLDTERLLFQSLLEELPQPRPLVLWWNDDELGQLFLAIDPAADEMVQLGRHSGEVPQLWLSARPGSPGFEPEHYELELTLHDELDDETPWASGRAGVRLRPQSAGRRIVTVRLHEELDVQQVTIADQAPPFTFRRGNRLHIVLDESVRPEQTIELVVTYEGQPFHGYAEGIYILKSTTDWYPRAGSIDRATYDVTLRWPTGQELLATGSLVDEGTEQEQRWMRRKLDIPVLGFSFEMGKFDVLEPVKTGHIRLQVAFSRVRGLLAPEVKAEAVRVMQAAVLFFESTFGALPVDDLTIVSVPRDFSQGHLGFVTLAHSLFGREPQGITGALKRAFGGRPVEEARFETIAHELAHQWWGNKMGWASDRDQWLSEALADYSAVLFMRRITQNPAIYLSARATDWQESLALTTPDGRTYESLGPVVLGTRLARNHGGQAYSAIVYKKGSVVFSMLARRLGEQPLQQMLRALVDAVDHRVIDTGTFLSSLERMSGRDLDSFASRFIYGTGLPEIYYDFAIRQEQDDRWIVEGRVQQLEYGSFGFRIADREGRFDVVGERRGADRDSYVSLTVPFQIAINGRQGDSSTTRGVSGEITIDGRQSDFSVPLDHEPTDFWLDQRGEILARFRCSSRQPKRMLRTRAEHLLGSGKIARAASLLEDALAAPVLGPSADRSGLSDLDLGNEARYQQILIWLGLARVHLQTGATAEAARALQRAEKLIGEDRGFSSGTRAVLHSRLELQTDQAKAAYSRLLDYLEPTGRAAASLAADRLRRYEERDAEAYALLAVAAYRSGKQAQLERLLGEAAARGVNVSALRSATAD